MLSVPSAKAEAKMDDKEKKEKKKEEKKLSGGTHDEIKKIKAV